MKEKDMSPKWMEIFKDEIDERIETAVETAVEAEKKEHEKTVLSSIKNLMKNMKWTVEKAMDAMEIPQDQRTKYAGMINGKCSGCRNC